MTDYNRSDIAELLNLLGLDAERYITEGGHVNIPKVKAALKYPADYPTKLDWTDPPHTQRWGFGMVCTDIELSKDETAFVCCTVKGAPMFARLIKNK